MKHFRSEHAFKKYKPHESWRKRLARIFRKKQPTWEPAAPASHYKSHPFRDPAKPKTSKVKVILFFVILALWVACLAYLPYFRINKVDYFGLNNITKQEINYFMQEEYLNKKSHLPLNNYFFINAGTIAKKIQNTFPVEKAEVVKVFPDKLEITITEKTSSVIYDNGKKYFLLDSEGTVTKYLTDVEASELKKKTIPTMASFDTTSSTTSTIYVNTTTYEHTPNNEKINDLYGDYPIIYDRRELPITIKQAGVLPSEYIEAVLAWYTYLNEQGKATPKFFILEDLSSGMIIDTALSWNIIFQPKDDTTVELNTFKEVLPNIKPKEYVDLRFGEKVYWK